MKYWSILCVVIYFFAFTSSAQDTYRVAVAENPNVIFETAPQGDDLLITFEAFSGYHGDYKKAENYKAFAQSEGGAWAYVTQQESQEVANTEALKNCQGYNTKFADSYPCELVNVGGEWISNDNRAQEILSSLPEFTPQEPIDLQALSNNSLADIENEEYPLALAKRIWFHQNALKVDIHYTGVRLSFALSAWNDLGERYPPARTLLRYIAYSLEESLLDNPVDFTSQAIEYKSINSALKRDDQSASFFRWVDMYHSEFAPILFNLFQDELIKFDHFELYNSYLSPNVNYSQSASSYALTLNSKTDDEELNEQYANIAADRFIFEVSRLVAILVINNRNEEAELIIKKAKLELDSTEFTQSLNEALEGKLPKR